MEGEGGSYVYGPYGLENAYPVVHETEANYQTFLTSTTEDETYAKYKERDENDWSALPVTTDDPYLLPSTTEDTNNAGQQQRLASHETKANDTTFWTPTTEDETYAKYEQRDENDWSALPITTGGPPLLPSTMEHGNNADQQQRHASHEADANPYADYLFDRVRVGPGQSDFSAENLPPILHRLEKQKDKQLKLGVMNVSNEIQFGSSGRALRIVPSLPRHISYHVNGWILEYLYREDDTTSASDIVSRMDPNEAKFSHARELREAAKHKAKQGSSKKYSATDQAFAEREAPDLTKPGNVDKIGHNFHMKRDRDCREPLEIMSWERRRTFPTKKDCIRIDKLSDKQIKHNTTLKVTEHGLQRVRLVGGFGEKKRAEPIVGSYLPLDFYLENSQEHVPGAHISKAVEVLRELRQKAEAKRLSHWTNLGVDDWPEQWRKQTRSLKSTPAKKRKDKENAEVEEDVAKNAETSGLDEQKVTKAKSGPTKKAKSNRDSESTAAAATGPQQTQSASHLAPYISYPPPPNRGHGMARNNVNYQGQAGQTPSQASGYVPHAGQIGSLLSQLARYVPNSRQMGSPLPPVAPGRSTPGWTPRSATNTLLAAAPEYPHYPGTNSARPTHGPDMSFTNDPYLTHGLDMSFINDPNQRPGGQVETFYREQVRRVSRERLGIDATPAEMCADMREEYGFRINNPGTAQWLRLLCQQLRNELAA